LDPKQTNSLVIVPDGWLWYLPFEALVLPNAPPPGVLGDRILVRYGPTAALAIGDARPFRRVRHTGIAVGAAGSTDAGRGDDAWDRLKEVAAGPIRLTSPSAKPSYLLAPLLDELISLDDVEFDAERPLDWSPLPRHRGRRSADNAAQDTIEGWLTMPFSGPQRTVVTGFSTLAEQGLKGAGRGAARDQPPGHEVFQAVCSLMATGSRTILISRWRTSGRTNLDLVREFVRELPNTSAVEAWQRSVLLARESPLNVELEPRLKRPDEAEEPPSAGHPFLWAGYLLIDSASRAPQEAPAEDDTVQEAGEKPAAADLGK
jgi:hypothetical protein